MVKRSLNIFSAFAAIFCVWFVAASCAGANKAARSRRGAVPQSPAAYWETPQTHVETWAYDDGCSGGVGASAELARRWLTYAESSCGPNARKAQRDCHSRSTTYCLVMQYMDTEWQYDAAPVVPRSTSDSWWLHEPKPHQNRRIYTSDLGGGYLINQTNPQARRFFQSIVRSEYNEDDGLLMDWQSAILSAQLYYATCGCSTTNEIASNAALRASHQEMSAALSHVNGVPFMQVDNSLLVNPWLPSGLDMLNRAIGVVGLVIDGSPEQYGTLTPYYATLLDDLAYIDMRTTAFAVPLSRGNDGAQYELRSRRVQEATILLAYSPGHVVDWADLDHGSHDLAVWPEEGIYPTRPLQSMGVPGGAGCLLGMGVVCSTGGHNDLQVAPGVYRREFLACYDSGVPVGGCAVLMNTTSRPVTAQSSWLKGIYRHEITLIGGVVQSGGRINLTGADFNAGSTTIAPEDAILLAR